MPSLHLLRSFRGLRFRLAFARNPRPVAACRLPHPHSPTLQFLGVCTGCAVVASLPSAKLHLHHPGAPHPARSQSSSLFGLYRAPSCPHPGLPTGCGGREVERVVATRPTPPRAQALPLFFTESRLSSARRKWRERAGRSALAGHAGPGCSRVLEAWPRREDLPVGQRRGKDPPRPGGAVGPSV